MPRASHLCAATKLNIDIDTYSELAVLLSPMKRNGLEQKQRSSALCGYVFIELKLSCASTHL